MKSLAHVLCLCSFLMVPRAAIAGPAEEANATVDRWSAAYTSNDPEAVVKTYTPDAILLGTLSPIISEGTEGIRKYFSLIKDSGNKNAIGERRTIVVDDNAVLVTGFYEFTRLADGQPVAAPSRFTMLVTKRDGEWRIAHHHSSPRVKPK
jgi:uncharacterized protein (TIGR02246 family)